MPQGKPRTAAAIAVLSALAALWNWNAPTVFFDSQIMLGGSLAVFALLQFGWAGLFVGAAALGVTFVRWGHPYEFVVGILFLTWLKVFLDRFNGGPQNNDNGRVVLAAVAFWAVPGMLLELFFTTKFLAVGATESLGVGLKESVTGVANTALGLALYLGAKLWLTRSRPGAVSLRGLTFAAVMACITVPSIAITLILSHQLKDSALEEHRDNLRQFGQEVSHFLSAGKPDAIGSLSGNGERMNFAWRSRDGRSASSDPELFRQLAEGFAPETPDRANIAGLEIYKPKAGGPVIAADRASYWITRDAHPGGEVIVAQPTQALIHRLDYTLLAPSFALLLVLLATGAVASELVGGAVDRQFKRVTGPLQTASADTTLPDLQSSQIQELEAVVSWVNRRSRHINKLNESIREAHSAERKAREEIARLIDGLPMSIAINTLGPDPGITFLNGAFTRTFGYTREDIPTLAEWAENAYPDPAYRAEVFGKWDAARARAITRKGTIEEMEFRVTCKDGTVRDTLFNAVVLGDSLVVTMADLTELKKAERKLRSAEAEAGAEKLVRERMTLAARASKAAFWDWDLATNAVTWSEEMKGLFGADRANAKTPFDSWAAWRQALHPDDLAGAEKGAMAAVRDGAPLALSYRILLPDGSVRWIDTDGDTIRDSSGKAVRIVGISRDVTERKNAEIELRSYRDQLEQLLAERTAELDVARRQLEKAALELTENIPVGTYTMVLPPGGGIASFSFLSARFLELTGLDAAQARENPMNAFACVHPDDRDEWVRKNAHVFEHKLPFHGECRILRGGETRWIVAESTPRSMPDGSVVWEGALTDITDRKLAERKLAESEEKYRNFFNLPLVGAAITTRGKGWVEANDQTCRILGYSREELFRKTWAEITHPEDLAKDNAEFVRMLRREIDGYTIEKRFIRKDGTTAHTILSMGFAAAGDGEPEMFFVNLLDIGERKTLEEDLRRSEERHRLLADNAADVINVIGLNGKLLYVSPSVERLIGYTQEEALKLSVEDILVPEAAAGARAGLEATAAAIASGAPLPEFQGEFPHRHKDGSTVWAEATSTCMVDKDGKYVATLVVTRDISKRKQLEAELAAAREREKQNEEKMRAALEKKLKTSLNAAAVAHEINQPLSRILLRARMNLEKSPGGKDEMLHALIGDAERVVQTIDKMKVLLRNVESVQEDVDLDEVLTSALHQLKSAIRAGKISVSRPAPEGACTVRGDAVQLKMVFVNLLQNAIDATRHRGGAAAIAVGRTARDGRIEVTIGDSGAGWPGGTLDEVLLNTTKPGGSGIGLYIVKTAVENHRGQIAIGRSPLGGAEFRVTFPRPSTA